MHDPVEKDEATFSSVVFLMFAVALAAAIHFLMNDRFENEVRRQVTRKADLAEEVEGRRAFGKELEIMRDALKSDPQTVERELRKNGWGRPGDVRIHVIDETK